MKQLQTRTELPILFRDLGLQSGVEVGVAEGGFSKEILTRWNGFLYMVDCWQHQPETVYNDVSNHKQDIMEQVYARAVEVANEFPNRTKILRQFSIDGAKTVAAANEEIGFVYLDANHKYEVFMEDLEVWYPLVRSGGVVSGHDYLDGYTHNTDFGVVSALRDFTKDMDVEINVIDETWPSWWFIKP